MFKRLHFDVLQDRLQEPRRFLQVLCGPRQTGKTTIARQLATAWPGPHLYASADEPSLRHDSWLEQQWERARLKLTDSQPQRQALLILDEIQKLPNWSETVKRLWDDDTAAGRDLKLVLLGSSPLLLSQGLTESLAGRFELIHVTHWGYAEMREAFGYTLEDYIFFGGYPGAAALRHDLDRWRTYVNDALIETSVSKDILLLQRIHKPALLRRLFELACLYSGQVLSYQKIQGQLQDAGNTTTLAHYLDLLSGAGFVTGLEKHSGQAVRKRASSPKLLVLNTALLSALDGRTPDELQDDRDAWGRWIESAVGAWLVNSAKGSGVSVGYWQSRNQELDFVLARGTKLTAIEVKSSRKPVAMPGLETFCDKFPVTRKLLVGPQGIPVDEFLTRPAADWL